MRIKKYFFVTTIMVAWLAAPRFTDDACASFQPLIVEEQDGSPSVKNVRSIRYSNGSLTPAPTGDGSIDVVLGDASITANVLDYVDFKDAMSLDASTSITADGTEVLTVTNTGTGNSFVVNDQLSDTTPFKIDASGNVGIGTTSTSNAQLNVEGVVSFREQPSSALTGSFGKLYVKTDSDPYFMDEGGGDYNLLRTNGRGVITAVRKAADESVTNSTTLQNDDELLFSLKANTNYVIEGALFVEGTTGDFKMAFDIPSLAVMDIAFIASALSGMRDAELLETDDTANTTTIETLSGGPTVIYVFGTVSTGSGSGTMFLRWAQFNSSGVPTTIKIGSSLKLFEIP